MTLGSKSREKDLRRRFQARLQRWSPEKITDADNVIAALWAMKDVAKVRSAIEYLDHMLDGFRQERLIPKIVEEAPRAPLDQGWPAPNIGAGHLEGKTGFNFPSTHRRQQTRPEIIAAWREVDNDPSELTPLTKS